jgi:hypothetical protein
MKAQHKGETLLNDEEWAKIRRGFCLPPEARTSIELGIRTYRALPELDPVLPPARIRVKLRKLKNQARELLRGFDEALRHDDVYFALVRRPWESRLHNPEPRKGLADHYRTEKVRADLNALIDWLDQSEGKLSTGKSGPSAEDASNVYLFVDLIDNVLDYYTKKGLTRSKHHRRMMEKIFAIVDPKAKGIDTAMRQVTDYGKRSDGKLLLPGSRHYRSGRR